MPARPLGGREIKNEPYRYGYQGQFAEMDSTTGWNHFELRQYGSRIGRWTTTDPYRQYYSPYVGMGNNPVYRTDSDGGLDTEYDVINGKSIKVTNKGGKYVDYYNYKDGPFAGQTLVAHAEFNIDGDFTGYGLTYWTEFIDGKANMLESNQQVVIDQLIYAIVDSRLNGQESFLVTDYFYLKNESGKNFNSGRSLAGRLNFLNGNSIEKGFLNISFMYSDRRIYNDASIAPYSNSSFANSNSKNTDPHYYLQYNFLKPNLEPTNIPAMYIHSAYNNSNSSILNNFAYKK